MDGHGITSSYYSMEPRLVPSSFLILPLYICSPTNLTSIVANTEQEKRADVISKCISTEPKHGEIWQSIAKDPANARKSTEEILKMVADQLN